MTLLCRSDARLLNLSDSLANPLQSLKSQPSREYTRLERDILSHLSQARIYHSKPRCVSWPLLGWYHWGHWGGAGNCCWGRMPLRWVCSCGYLQVSKRQSKKKGSSDGLWTRGSVRLNWSDSFQIVSIICTYMSFEPEKVQIPHSLESLPFLQGVKKKDRLCKCLTSWWSAYMLHKHTTSMSLGHNANTRSYNMTSENLLSWDKHYLLQNITAKLR